MCGKAPLKGSRFGFAPGCAARLPLQSLSLRLCARMCGEAPPRRFPVNGVGCAPGAGFALKAGGRTSGKADFFPTTFGEAEPRRTSGGRAEVKNVTRKATDQSHYFATATHCFAPANITVNKQAPLKKHCESCFATANSLLRDRQRNVRRMRS